MEMVLLHPEYGYYRQGDPIGSERDFSTAPEVSQMFGEILGVWCLEMWKKMGSPDAFVLLELGPGHGTLLSDLLGMLEQVPEFAKAVRLRLIESNKTLRDVQREKLARFNPVHIDDLSQLGALPALVISNELFDNIPTRQFVKRVGGWVERMVGLAGDELALVDGPTIYALPPDTMAADRLAGVDTGWVHEFSDQSRKIVAALAEHVAKHGGAGVIVDYGYIDPHGKGTFDAWSLSKPSEILASPGNVDVTVDVDFSSLARVAERAGAYVPEPVEQGKFLSRYGLAARADALKKKASRKQRRRVDADFRTLLSPLIMGARWKALVFMQKGTRAPGGGD
jgi:NADH dehydrogenase [ubiquinone] 1 alpha subcomplex assembly factor 7